MRIKLGRSASLRCLQEGWDKNVLSNKCNNSISQKTVAEDAALATYLNVQR